MTELLTAAQMRSLEAAAIASGEVTGLELMERAGRGVVEAVFAEWPELAAGSHRAVVLCGPGGNGGDGFVVARLLKEWGWEVEVFLLGRQDRLPPDAAVNLARWRDLRGEVQDLRRFGETGRPFDLSVDAIFGSGVSRPVPTAVSQLKVVSKHRVAVDVPSGLCATSGRFLRESREDRPMPVDLTVTFHKMKIGHVLQDGAELCGRVVVKSIGLSATEQPHDWTGEWRDGPIHESDSGARGWLIKSRVQHKYSHGHALILSGGVGHGGAARLAARGALRIGAGVVTVGCPPSAVIENAARLDAVMLRRVGDAGALAEVLEDRRINAVCLGPGMGVSRAKEMLGVVLGAVREDHAPYAERRSVVIDADGLTALAEAPELFAMLHEECVLTPHGGEFARVFPDIAAKLAEPAVQGPAYSKVDACREAAARAGCVVLFKGADTVIAHPSGECSINSAAYERAAPWLATAGSGDVLAGFIAGLLARGFNPMQAAETAAWLHVECARSFGPGLIAEDLPEELPKVFRALGL